MVEVRDTLFGRNRVLEPAEHLSIIHVRDTSKKLKATDWTPKIAILDQEDYAKQGIDVSTFIKGAKKVDALGCCTADTSVEVLSNVLTVEEFTEFVNQMGVQDVSSALNDVYSNTVAGQRAAIGFYHGCTDQTKRQTQEWPPTDCGSNGVDMLEYMIKGLALPVKQALASGADSVVSLMQTSAIALGTSWLNVWMNPGSDFFIDGNGKLSTIEAQIRNGVAGGHEITMSRIEKLVIHTSTGLVDPFNTIVEITNHWDNSWADGGRCLAHLSTFTSGPMASQADMRAVIRA